ncbi:MAG: hypothetical protein V4440_04215, partial [Pseudomonadota bacterium]
YGAKKVLFVTKKKAIGSIQQDFEDLAPGYDLFLTNFESLHKCGKDFDLIIVDESHSIGAYPQPSERTKELKKIPNVIMPFPGGVVRSGSKVGSKYKTMFASTNDAFCPTLKGATNTELSPEIESVMEIVIDGIGFDDIAESMRVGIQAICDLGETSGVKRISAGNYGGKLGPHHFKLHEIMSSKST